MKNKIIYLLLLFVFFLPLNVFAAIPESGVTYFFTYPNGLETVSTNYQDAINPKEELIFTTTSDSNGQVVLNDWGNEGEIRIVEKVPNGYSIENREITVNLANSNSAEFVNIHGIINPKTGKSILLVIEVLIVLLGFCFLLSRQKKSSLFLFGIVAFMFALLNVKADQDDFVITVQDKDGNRLSDVVVEVYAKPVKVEGVPAIKVNANGGQFLDGTDEMYLRLPYDGCTYEDFMAHNYYNYLDSFLNLFGAYRTNYYTELPDFYDVLFNGDEYDLEWAVLEEGSVNPTIDFNGGVFHIRGVDITSLSAESLYSEIATKILNRIENNSNYLIGIDINRNCSSYKDTGVYIEPEPTESMSSTQSKYYFCWHSKPDGLYINDRVYVGDIDSCYNQFISGANIDCGAYIYFGDQFGSQFYISFSNGFVQFRPIYYQYANSGLIHSTMPGRSNSNSQVFSFDSIGVTVNPSYEYVDTLEIIQDGETFVSLDASDFEYDRDDGLYTVTNSSKSNRILNYFSNLYDHCTVCE